MRGVAGELARPLLPKPLEVTCQGAFTPETRKGAERGPSFLEAGPLTLTHRAWTLEGPPHEPPTPTASPRAAVKVRRAGKVCTSFLFPTQNPPGTGGPQGASSPTTVNR